MSTKGKSRGLREQETNGDDSEGEREKRAEPPIYMSMIRRRFDTIRRSRCLFSPASSISRPCKRSSLPRRGRSISAPSRGGASGRFDRLHCLLPHAVARNARHGRELSRARTSWTRRTRTWHQSGTCYHPVLEGRRGDPRRGPASRGTLHMAVTGVSQPGAAETRAELARPRAVSGGKTAVESCVPCSSPASGMPNTCEGAYERAAKEHIIMAKEKLIGAHKLALRTSDFGSWAGTMTS